MRSIAALSLHLQFRRRPMPRLPHVFMQSSKPFFGAGELSALCAARSATSSRAEAQSVLLELQFRRRPAPTKLPRVFGRKPNPFPWSCRIVSALRRQFCSGITGFACDSAQYARAKMALSEASPPQRIHVPLPASCSSGMQRIVALVSSLTWASQSALPHHQV
jgi:hypothetical protein